MNILWITNQPTPDICKEMNISSGFGGGWMNVLSDQLSVSNELFIAFPYENVNKTNYGEFKGIKYYCLLADKTALYPSNNLIEEFENIIREVKPDVIHIWGTEYVHSCCAMRACEHCGVLSNTVISIQGLVSVYASHFFCGLDKKQFRIPTIHDLKNRSSLAHKYHSFLQRGIYEREAIKLARHIIGRTDWDKACTELYNPMAQYHVCNETLRQHFYRETWNINKCNKYTIFVSQSQYPIKGFHYALDAVAILKEKWPNIQLLTTGKNRMDCSIIKMGDYDLHLRNKIHKLNLQNNVKFVGMLNEEKMCKAFLGAHIFLSPSSIENSPNSVGEAMLLGMPVISSDVGGVKNMLTHGNEGYIYPCDEPYMIAYYANKIFENDDLAIKLGNSARIHAQITHNQEKNYTDLVEIQ